MSTRIVVLTLLICALTACANRPATPDTTATASRAGTTIAVPDGASLLAQRLHQSLTERGWRLTTYDPSSLQNNRNYGRLATRARYRLTFSATRIGACRDSSPSFLYNIALIENRSGNVGLALTGANCIDTTVRRFRAELDRKQLTVQP